MKCSICDKEIPAGGGSWTQGNNAEPVNNGRCCNECNMAVVIPARLQEVRQRPPAAATMTAMKWNDYLKFLVDVEQENVEENYRAGRAANGADEEMNRDTRIGFANLQAVLPTLLAAQELLAALKYMVENAEAEGWSGLMISDAVAAIAKAEGRSE